MGGNLPVGTVWNTTTLTNRAMEIYQSYQTLGQDAPSSYTDPKSGAIFNFTKDESGKVTATYNLKSTTSPSIFINTNAVSSGFKLTSMTSELQEEYLQNNTLHYYNTQYRASQEQIDKKTHLELDLNSHDKETREKAREEWLEIVTTELYSSGSYDIKSAKVAAKYALNDKIAGLRSDLTTVYYDQTEFKKAEIDLEKRKKTAVATIALYENLDYNSLSFEQKEALASAEVTMQESVTYIKNGNVRDYIEKRPDLFCEKNPETGDYEFSSDKYKKWATNHAQGDHTSTVSERKNSTAVTYSSLSQKDVKKSAKYANLDTQKDPTLTINLAKSVAGILAGTLHAYWNTIDFDWHKSFKEYQNLDKEISFKPSSDGSNSVIMYIDGYAVATVDLGVHVDAKRLARDKAFSSAVISNMFNYLLNPEKMVEYKADAVTSSTLAEQNIFRQEVTETVQGNVVVDCNCDDKKPETKPEEDCSNVNCNADIKKISTADNETKENVVYVKSYHKDEKKRSHWYDFASAYHIPQGVSIKAVYRAIQKRNGYSNEKPNPPLNVMLPQTLDLGNGITVTRKDTFEIAKHDIPKTGNKKGSAPGGKPQIKKRSGSTYYEVYDCNGTKLQKQYTLDEAKTKYKELTGNDFVGNL